MRANSAPEVCRSSATRSSPSSGNMQPRLHGRERDDRAGGDRARRCRIRYAGDQVDDRRDDRQEDADHREEPLAAHLLAYLQPDLVVVLGGVPADLVWLLVEALGEQDARHAQRLLGDRRHVRQRLLRLRRDPRSHLARPGAARRPGSAAARRRRASTASSAAASPTNAAMTVTVLPRTLEMVLFSTLATPPTSFCSRDWMTPVLVRVKKPSSIALQVGEQPHPHRAHHLVADRRGEVGLPDAEAGATRPRARPSRRRGSPAPGRSGPAGGKRPRSNACWVSSGGMTLRAPRRAAPGRP